MTPLKRGMVIEVNLDPTQGSETGKIRPRVIVTNNIYNEQVPVIQVIPITAWSEKKGLIKTNVTLLPNSQNGLVKTSIADCLQHAPLRGILSHEDMTKIDEALKIVFAL